MSARTLDGSKLLICVLIEILLTLAVVVCCSDRQATAPVAKQRAQVPEMTQVVLAPRYDESPPILSSIVTHVSNMTFLSNEVTYTEENNQEEIERDMGSSFSNDSPTTVGDERDGSETDNQKDLGQKQVLSGFSWEAEEGNISAPFFVENSYVLQSVETLDPMLGGRASYQFTVTEPGDYVVTAILDAPDTAANSVFINIDSEPTSPVMIWDAQPTLGFQHRMASWRGSGTDGANEFVPKRFFLAPGEHELVIRGREANTRLDRLAIIRLNHSVHLPIIERADSTTFYVSKAGNNTDGRSWATAWNELDQIAWDRVKPGSVVMIAGGEYHTRMGVGASGVFGAPITITTDGNQVVLDGLRPAPPYCGQQNYDPVPGRDGIGLEGREYIIIDGREWRGIVIRNHDKGIRLRERAHNIIVRNVEIYDNGGSIGSGSNREPDGPGVDLGGSNILFERVIIHDNGQDAFQAGWGVWNFTLRDSWLYNSREHPTQSGLSFNYCSHTDGVQIYDGGAQGPIVVENSIIGPSFTQGIIIGAAATVDNVVISNTLFVGNTNAGIIISYDGASSAWRLQNVTVVQPLEDCWNVQMRDGNNHIVNNSVFQGGPWGIRISDWVEASGNYYWLTRDWYGLATELDPMFVDDEYSGVGEGFADFDFTIQNPTIPPGTGSSITSLDKLLSQQTWAPAILVDRRIRYPPFYR